ncbi:NtaA/DmoA family FMN-dependent monooxygenase [Pseudactinotalea sp.]|uniref:NtaA/DmoA family FMN-dependent monooxygenase n=1 Tax=Pseudactinotalea sp. TaxID=1926260 RepID=UPI003B3A2526
MNDKRHVILGASFPGVNHHTIWSDPRSGSQIDFSSFVHLAQAAERGRFDFLFQAEGLRVREHKGSIYELDIAGRPDILTQQAALAGITEHLSFLSTINSTFNEPYELARKLASHALLSGGRIGWNIVTSSDAFHGGNFRRGGYLAREERYERAAEVTRTVLELLDSWSGDGDGSFTHAGKHVDIAGRFPLRLGSLPHPVLVQAGVSDEGRDFAARSVDVIFSPYSQPDEGRAFTADVRSRAERAGRDPDTLKVLPGASFVLGDSQAEAEQKAREVTRAQVSPQTALVLLEQVWLQDLSDVDPTGPVPEPDPSKVEQDITLGKTRTTGDPLARAREWYAFAQEKKLSVRELIIAKQSRQRFVGTASQVAEQIDDAVQSRVSDGFIIGSPVVPVGLDDFVESVVPILQERGVLRSEYEPGATFRDNLGLPPIAPIVRDGVAPFVSPLVEVPHN